MNRDEKAISRIIFKLKIYEADGDKFEDLFVSVMNYAEPDFQGIKAWGNIGDRKNDGYIPSKGIYYQVYAPEEITNNYPKVVEKLKTDLIGLLAQWDGVKEFYFVLNDKYNGVNADAEQTLRTLIKENNLEAGGFLTPKDLEKILFELEYDQIVNVIGFFPNPISLGNLNFSVLNEVIGFIMQLPIQSRTSKIEFPDWDEKIKFNKLSPSTKTFLDIGAQKLGALTDYLSNESFLAESLQEKLTGIYSELKEKDWENEGEFTGDFIFCEMVRTCSPKNES
jgi:hypothetical protein